MPSTHTLTCYRTGETLYEGRFPTLSACLEQAILEKVNLAGIDLSYANLSGGNFDDANMPDAKLRGANLSGANLSEAVLDNSDLSDAVLVNACLCESSLKACVFYGASFGATDIAGADLSGAYFSTLSAFDLEFAQARGLQSCHYRHADGAMTDFSRPPIVLRGMLSTPVIVFDKIVKIGASRLPLHTAVSIGRKMMEDILHHRASDGDAKTRSFLDSSKYIQLY
jgi:hypothetical protein